MVIKHKVKRSPKVVALLFGGLVMIGSSLGFAVIQKQSLAQTTTICPGGNVFMYQSGGTTNNIINGIGVVSVGLPTSMTETPGKVFITLDGQVVGQARPESGSTYQWIMQIPASVLDPRSTGYQLKAIIKYATFQCEVTASSPTPPILPTTTSGLLLQLNPTMLELPVNNQAIVYADISVLNTTVSFSQYAIFDWATESRGTVASAQNKQATFFSGPSVGDGRIKVVSKYGLRQQQAFISTKIVSTDSPIQTQTSPDSGTTSGTSSQSGTSTNPVSDTTAESTTESQNTNTTPIQPTASLQTNSATKECAESVLGQERFLAINAGQSRPTLEELNTLKACFARTNYILPSNFAPVAPTSVSTLPTGTNVKIAELKNDKKQVGELQKDVIRMTGTAKPNSTVIIYVFSEPLVLTTTADENGGWVYELENPLESGDHTMYAVVDRGDGVYEKTDPLAFVIGTAEASAENPAGLSLVLKETETAKDSMLSTFMYIGSTAILLAAIAVGVMFAYRRGRHSIAKEVVVNNVTDQPTIISVPPQTGSITTIGQPELTPEVPAVSQPLEQQATEPTPPLVQQTSDASTVEQVNPIAEPLPTTENHEEQQI